MMKSELPFLLDAIFGKKDLASVSLDEIYEVINEFPSFNAGHFLLSKKLKEQHDGDFEKESMRTALYFHNAFWLQTLLEDGNHAGLVELARPYEDENGELDYTENPPFDHTETSESFVVESMSQPADALNDEIEEILDEQIAEQSANKEFEFQQNENDTGRVMSFDDLISKYKIDGIESVAESPVELIVEPVHEPPPELKEEAIYKSFDDSFVETIQETPEESSIEKGAEFLVELNAEEAPHLNDNSDNGQFEILEEIINEYGIFEEITVRKSDLDLDAFDRPIEASPNTAELFSIEEPLADYATDSSEIKSSGDDTIIEKQFRETPSERLQDHDYEAFDRPTESANEEENLVETEPLKITSTFEAKNEESIVFAPYHMIDYFASQGIKLVLEDQPADNFGKQLKSFTDWLKVMKRIPAKPPSDKAEEKEAERIRHFAAHSIEERDILTESMAEVLAKQGMYENAIALYQKLSLIYPPKSAYFASRIEQLKASLP
jgi:hypothetical protein